MVGVPVDALASVVHSERAAYRGRQLCERLKDIIPRQLFEVAIQVCAQNPFPCSSAGVG